MTRIRTILNTIRKEGGVIFICLIIVTATYCYNNYKRATREQDVKITFGKIYQIESASKGNVNLNFYFLTQSGDTIKSSRYLYPENTGDYYLNNKFFVKYSAKDPENNEILLDRAY